MEYQFVYVPQGCAVHHLAQPLVCTAMEQVFTFAHVEYRANENVTPV